MRDSTRPTILAGPQDPPPKERGTPEPGKEPPCTPRLPQGGPKEPQRTAKKGLSRRHDKQAAQNVTKRPPQGHPGRTQELPKAVQELLLGFRGPPWALVGSPWALVGSP